jgi:hypothetical protein
MLKTKTNTSVKSPALHFVRRLTQYPAKAFRKLAGREPKKPEDTDGMRLVPGGQLKRDAQPRIVSTKSRETNDPVYWIN